MITYDLAEIRGVMGKHGRSHWMVEENEYGSVIISIRENHPVGVITRLGEQWTGNYRVHTAINEFRSCHTMAGAVECVMRDTRHLE